MGCKIIGAQQARLLCGNDGDDNRSPGRFRQALEGPGDAQQNGDAGGIVVGAVVDGIPFGGGAHA